MRTAKIKLTNAKMNSRKLLNVIQKIEMYANEIIM